MEWEVSIIDFRDNGKLAAYEKGEVFELDNVQIRDHRTYERMFVKAKFCKDPKKLPNGDVLWVKFYNEDLINEPVKIEILEKRSTGIEEYL